MMACENNAAGNFIARTETLSHRAVDSVLNIVLHGTAYCTLAAGYCIVARVYSTFSASSVASSAVSPRLSAASSGLTQFLP